MLSVNAVITNICNFCIEEFNMRLQAEEKIDAMLLQGKAIFKEFIDFLLDVGFQYYKNYRIFRTISFSVLCFFQMMPEVSSIAGGDCVGYLRDG